MVLPVSVLAELAAMDDYQRMLSIDKVAREHGVSMAEAEAALAAHQSGGGSASGTQTKDAAEISSTSDDPALYGRSKGDESPSYEEMLAQQRSETPMFNDAGSQAPGFDSQGNVAQTLPDASRYRMGYDPTREGLGRQDMVQQAILCPACHAPLGIPSIRPILVTCPQCLTETNFTA